MSKHVYPKKYTATSSSRYLSPLEIVDQRTRKFQPKKMAENNKYEQLYRQGECKLFEISPSLYRYFCIHGKTSVDTLDDLIDYATTVKHYTIDTEGQIQPKGQPSTPALIQIEFLAENSPSIIILIEAMHLPSKDSSTFLKTKKLCQTIFSNDNHIYSWGNATKELLNFCRYDLFKLTNLNQVIWFDVQPHFKTWFHTTDPFSPDRKLNSGNDYALQFAIKRTFNEWLDKRMTFANWGCGIDFKLCTINEHEHDVNIRQKKIQDEQEIREFMMIYAMNDCFSVTKLACELINDEHLKPPMIRYCNLECIYERNEPVELEIHPEWVHEQNESVELEIHPELPTVMVINQLQEEYQSNVHEQQEVHDANELRTNITYEQEHVAPKNDKYDHSIVMKKQKEQKKRRNQKKNQKKRANRYKFEVIRHVFYKFNENDVKEILINSNIQYVNVNIVGRTLFVGLKDESIRRRVDQLFTEDMFTPGHFERMQKRRQRKKTVKHKQY